MAKISDRTIDEVRERTDIVEIINARVPLKRAGSDFVACCPFHNEKTPSFHVNPARQSYHCFGCGKGGNVYRFLMDHDGMAFLDALKMLADRCGVSLELEKDDGRSLVRKRLIEIHAALAAFYRRCLLETKEASVAREYISSRGITEEIAEKFQIGYAPNASGILLKFAEKNRFKIDEMIAAGLLIPKDNGDFYERFRGRLMFPICDSRGQVIAFSGRILEKNDKAAKYVNSPETPVFVKSRTLYALDKAQKSIVSAQNREAIICEGQIDVIRCHSCGFSTAVAAQGTAFTTEHINLLKRYADSAVLVFDSDGAGRKAAVRTARIFLSAGIPVRVATMPEGEDPDSFLRENGADAFRTILSAASEVVPFHLGLLRSIEEQPDSMDAVGRESAEILETIACCKNAVHSARMLQEAAEILALPEDALRSELEAYKGSDDFRRKTESENVKIEHNGGAEEMSADEINALLAEAADNSELPPDIEIEGSGEGSRVLPPPREELMLCEILVGQYLESSGNELIELIRSHITPNLLKHPYCSAVAAAIFESVRTGKDKLLELQNSDSNIAEFVGWIGMNKRDFGAPGNTDFTLTDAARDIVLALWRRQVSCESDELSGPDAGVDAGIRRLQLSIELRDLRRWSSGEPRIAKRLNWTK